RLLSVRRGPDGAPDRGGVAPPVCSSVTPLRDPQRQRMWPAGRLTRVQGPLRCTVARCWSPSRANPRASAASPAPAGTSWARRRPHTRARRAATAGAPADPGVPSATSATPARAASSSAAEVTSPTGAHPPRGGVTPPQGGETVVGGTVRTVLVSAV